MVRIHGPYGPVQGYANVGIVDHNALNDKRMVRRDLKVKDFGGLNEKLYLDNSSARGVRKARSICFAGIFASSFR